MSGGGWAGPPARDSGATPLSFVSVGLGAFSVICCCCCYSGFWAGIPAIITGVMGLKKSPTGLGRTLSIVGIVLGSIGVLLALWNVISDPKTIDCDDVPDDLKDWCRDNT